MALGFVGGVGAIIGAIVASDSYPDSVGLWVLCAVVGIVLGIVMTPYFNKASELLANLQSVIASKMKIAWDQMAPLNRLYTWDVTVKLIEATVPRLEFDPYFTADRLASLHTQFGWDDSFNDGKSIIFAQSGVINGNPFVIGQYLDTWVQGREARRLRRGLWWRRQVAQGGCAVDGVSACPTDERDVHHGAV